MVHLGVLISGKSVSHNDCKTMISDLEGILARYGVARVSHIVEECNWFYWSSMGNLTT